MTATLVIQTAYIGDSVLTTPLLRRLAEAHGLVDVLCAPDSREVFETHDAVGQTIVFDKRGTDSGVSGIRRIAARLGGRYATAFLAHRSFRSAAVAATSRIPKRVGFADSPWSFLYTDRRTASGPHETLRYLSLVADRVVSIPEAESRPSIVVTAEDRDAAVACLKERGISSGQKHVVLAPGSAWETKRWPFFPDLAAELSKDLPVAVIGREGDWDETARAPVADLTGVLSIRQATAVIEAAALAVTNDSAPLHLAAAAGTPTLALFGPTSPHLGFGPRGVYDEVAGVEGLACRPCSMHGGKRCPLRHHKCMNDLDAESVAGRARAILSRIEEDG